MIAAATRIVIGSPFRKGTKFSKSADEDLRRSIDEINDILAAGGSHARLSAYYGDSGAYLMLAVEDSLDN